jgi:type II secretory pathway pseudopilin PulG
MLTAVRKDAFAEEVLGVVHLRPEGGSILKTNRRQAGFSLVELALGLVIVATLLSALLVPLATQLDQRRTAETQRLLEVAREALYGFVVAQDRFPCPATAGSNGAEAFATSPSAGNPNNGFCLSFRGFLPAATLGLSPLDREGFQTDAFGGDANRIRFAVADVDFDPGNKLYTAAGKMRALGMTVISSAPNRFSVCSTANTVAASGCPAGGVTLANGNAIAVVLSVGRNPEGRGDDENENLDLTAGNQVFVSRIQSDAAVNPFDDMLLWVSPNVLISRLAAAGKLP